MGIYDIESILKRLRIKYRGVGGNYLFLCISPYHNDKNASMSMNDEGLYQCWSCGERGNLHTFIKALTGQTLYDFLDIKDPMSFEFKRQLSAQKHRDTFPEPEERKLYLKGSLMTPYRSDQVMEYIASLNINREFMEFFDITYTTHSTLAFIKTDKPTHFYNRMTVPVYRDKKMINMIGRDYTGKSSKKELYPKGSITDTFFNIDNVDLTKPLIVVEGFKGLIRIWQHFHRNVISSFGSNLGKNQREILAKVDNLLLFSDNDKAGHIMADLVYKIREKDFRITMMRTEGFDPADGPLSELEYALRHPLESVDYFMRRNGLIQSKEISW